MKRHLATLLGLVVAVSPLYLIRITVAGVPVYLPELPLLAAFVVWAYLVSQRQLAVVWPPRPVVWLVGIFMTLCLMATIVNGPETLGALKSWVMLPAVYGWLVLQLVGNDAAAWPTLRRLITAAIVVVAGFAFVQALEGTVRPSSFFNSPNALAMWLVPLLFIAQPSVKQFADWLLILIVVAAVGVSGSIGGLGALGLGAAVWLFSERSRISPKTWAYLVGGALAVMTTISVTPYLDSIMVAVFGVSLGARTEIWEVARVAVASHPLFGIGPGGFEGYYLGHVGSLIATPLEWAVPQPHNLYLATAVAAGLPALGALAAVIGLAAYYQRLRRSGILAAATAAIAVHGLVDTQYWKNDLAIIFFLLVALSCLPARSSTSQHDTLTR